MNAHEFNQKFGAKVREERRITNEILHMINEFSETRGYLKLAYSSLFDWLVRGHGYSESAAYRRIEGARLIKAVPQAAIKLETGEVSLTQLAKVQSAVRAQEKLIKHKISAAEKAAAVVAVTGKPKLEAEMHLLSLFPAAQPEVSRDHLYTVDAETLRLAFNISKNVMDDLGRAKEILSHTIPGGENGKVLARLLKEFLDRNDPLRYKPRAVKISLRTARRAVNSVAENSRVNETSLTKCRRQIGSP